MKEIFKEMIQAAINKASEDITKYFPEAYEEEITGILILEFRRSFMAFKDILKARFLEDLIEKIKEVPGNENIEYEKLKSYLNENTDIETVRHNRIHENRKSKGDFGIVIAYPVVNPTQVASMIQILMVRRGLIVQSKRKPSYKDRNPRIQRSNKNAYERIVKFYSFLLYNMKDYENLKFEFVLPSLNDNDSSVRIKEAFKKLLNKKSEKISFMKIVEDLINGYIGTSDTDDLDEILLSKNRKSIEFIFSYNGPSSFEPPPREYEPSFIEPLRMFKRE